MSRPLKPEQVVAAMQFYAITFSPLTDAKPRPDFETLSRAKLNFSESDDDGRRNENSQAISVTPTVTKCGRPATGAAMTNAERQAKHGAKQKEQDSRQRELEGMPG